MMKAKGIVETYLACVGDYFSSHPVSLLVILLCVVLAVLLFYAYTRGWNRTWAKQRWQTSFCYAVVVALVSFWGLSAWQMSDVVDEFISDAQVDAELCRETAKELVRMRELRRRTVDGDGKDACRLMFHSDEQKRMDESREVLKRLVFSTCCEVNYLSELGKNDIIISDEEVKKVGATVVQVFGELAYTDEMLAELTEFVRGKHDKCFRAAYEKSLQEMSSPWALLIVCYLLVGVALYFHCRNDIESVKVSSQLNKYREV